MKGIVFLAMGTALSSFEWLKRSLPKFLIFLTIVLSPYFAHSEARFSIFQGEAFSYVQTIRDSHSEVNGVLRGKAYLTSLSYIFGENHGLVIGVSDFYMDLSASLSTKLVSLRGGVGVETNETVKYRYTASGYLGSVGYSIRVNHWTFIVQGSSPSQGRSTLQVGQNKKILDKDYGLIALEATYEVLDHFLVGLRYGKFQQEVVYTLKSGDAFNYYALHSFYYRGLYLGVSF